MDFCHISFYPRCGVGTEGTLQTLFYAEVTDQMRVNSGGGLVEEGEIIEVAELPRKDTMTIMMDESVTKPVGMMFGFLLVVLYERQGRCLHMTMDKLRRMSPICCRSQFPRARNQNRTRKWAISY